jgi:hypothetical protein
MSKPYTRPSTPDDCAELALSMRQADRTEIALGGSPGPFDSLMRGLAYSDSCESIIAPNGAVVGMVGVVRLSPQLGSPWMLAADGLTDIKWQFLRECRERLQVLHAQYPHLFNQVWEGNTTHIRWLKWLGFTVADKPLDRPNFLPFWKNHV